ncbi:MAG: hypothetical protein EBU90_22295 [Proteobacteria bacterium]|nr:hypothetical protein [Pseudomonadota bacterium]
MNRVGSCLVCIDQVRNGAVGVINVGNQGVGTCKVRVEQITNGTGCNGGTSGGDGSVDNVGECSVRTVNISDERRAAC